MNTNRLQQTPSPSDVGSDEPRDRLSSRPNINLTQHSANIEKPNTTTQINTRREIKCYNYKQLGHLIRDCPNDLKKTVELIEIDSAVKNSSKNNEESAWDDKWVLELGKDLA